MAKKNENPSIEEFKTFVRQHPDLIKEVKQKGESWQGYYEKWVLLGEDDPYWEKYKSGGKGKITKDSKTKEAKDDKQELMNQLLKMAENVDFNKVQGHINQINGAITNIQSLIGQFQEAKKQFSSNQDTKPPFRMNRD